MFPTGKNPGTPQSDTVVVKIFLCPQFANYNSDGMFALHETSCYNETRVYLL